MSKLPRRKPQSNPAAGEAHVDLSTPGAPASPPLPNERDEGAGMTGGETSGRVQQGQRDIKRGLEDTSRAPEADDAYRKLKK